MWVTQVKIPFITPVHYHGLMFASIQDKLCVNFAPYAIVMYKG